MALLGSLLPPHSGGGQRSFAADLMPPPTAVRASSDVDPLAPEPSDSLPAAANILTAA